MRKLISIIIVLTMVAFANFVNAGQWTNHYYYTPGASDGYDWHKELPLDYGQPIPLTEAQKIEMMIKKNANIIKSFGYSQRFLESHLYIDNQRMEPTIREFLSVIIEAPQTKVSSDNSGEYQGIVTNGLTVKYKIYRDLCIPTSMYSSEEQYTLDDDTMYQLKAIVYDSLIRVGFEEFNKKH